ncbi:Uncharacterised protein [Mycobacteroides abscessus subsp. abscessus]|nr:Uncharacterised protein [Mycobacteroides abscessus subsp. abscessus]
MERHSDWPEPSSVSPAGSGAPPDAESTGVSCMTASFSGSQIACAEAKYGSAGFTLGESP